MLAEISLAAGCRPVRDEGPKTHRLQEVARTPSLSDGPNSYDGRPRGGGNVEVTLIL